MKFISKNPIEENIYNLIRKLGYRFMGRDEKKSEIIFIKPLDRNGYPRFHLYLKINEEEIMFNLHLDQKKPSYKGTLAHSGEYEGKIVEKEVKRIKENLKLNS